MRAIFFSDVHILRNDPAKIELLQNFARDILSEADQIFILGDLFEFYHGYDKYIYPWYQSAADTLRALGRGGRELFLVEGNHEFGMGSYFQSYTGATCTNDHLVIDLDGKKVYLSHGEMSDRFCLGSALKSPFVYTIMDCLGPYATWKIARAAGFFISRKTKPYNRGIKDIFRQYGRSKLDEGYDAVILAHSHIQDKVDFGARGKEKIYLNTGDFGKHSHYVLYESTMGFTLQTYYITCKNE